MLKEDGIYIINGQEARFHADVEKGMFSTTPVGVFIFKDGTELKTTHNVLTGTSVCNGETDRAIIYQNGSWRFR